MKPESKQDIVEHSQPFPWTRIDGYCLVDGEGRVLEVNDAYCQVTGYNEAELTSMHISDLESPEMSGTTIAHIRRAIEDGEDRFETVQCCKYEKLFDVELTLYSRPTDGEERVAILLRDISGRKQAEKFLSVQSEILAILSAQPPIQEASEQIVSALKREIGFDAVGLRLSEGSDYPFAAATGYSEEFLRTENTLSSHFPHGWPCPDKHGLVKLGCTCGLVLEGNTDPTSPLYTPGGSVWTNDLHALENLLREEDRLDSRMNPRIRCVEAGFQSLALVPLRAGDEIIGLLHIADRSKNRFTQDSIRFFEGISTSIGIALNRIRYANALHLNEEQHAAILRTVMDGFWLVDGQARLLEVNDSYARMSGYTEEELLAMRIPDLEYAETPDQTTAHMEKIIAHGEDRFESQHRRKDGSIMDVEVSVQSRPGDPDGRFVGFLRDITDRKSSELELEHRRLRLEELLKEREADQARLERAFSSTIQVIGRLVEVRDPYTASHMRRVSDLAVAIAGNMGMPPNQIDDIRVAGLIHDIGKMSVPLEILSKPGKLMPTEFKLIKLHPQIGYEILTSCNMEGPIAEIIRQHHERIDGSGYPQRLTGDRLLMSAKILAVADVVEAINSHRPYRPALGLDAALAEIQQGAGVRYDADTCDSCARLFRDGNFEFSEELLHANR